MLVNFLTNALGLAVIGFAGDYFGLQSTYLVSAILMEIDDAWQTGRVYLTFERDEPSS